MSFNVAAEAYQGFMGRFSEPLAILFADEAGVGSGRALDVGCGPGALTSQLVKRLGAEAVAALDPSPSFVDAARNRFPDVDIRHASAEQIPFEDDSFDYALAELVVHFMTDPVAGLREMGRVTRTGGTVAACVWDYAGNASPLSLFWTTVAEISPGAVNESGLPGAREGHLAELCAEAGFTDVTQSYLTVSTSFGSAEEWWEPYTFGIGPAGEHVKALPEDQRARLKAECLERLPAAPFELTASAWCATAVS